MIISLAAIALVIVAYLAIKTKIHFNDLKKQIGEWDENSYQ